MGCNSADPKYDFSGSEGRIDVLVFRWPCFAILNAVFAMKILLLGTYENDGRDGSMQKFAALMAKGLTQAGHEVRFFRPPTFFGQIHASPGGFGKWIGYVDKFAVFPMVLKSAIQWADLVHVCDHSTSYYVAYLESVPHVVTCHDLLAIRSALGEIPQHHTRWAGRRLQRMVLNGLRNAEHIVCVSDATQRDLLRTEGISRRRVSRIYNSLNYPYSRMEQREARSLIATLSIDPGETFFLHVGGNQWYKNRFGVLRIFAALRKLGYEVGNLKLVMVGDLWTAEMREFVLAEGMSDVAFELAWASDEQLRALYSSATALLFPSLREGFGWPIIEAQACDCPVITSNRSPMDEVAGEAAVYVDPEDPDGAASIIKPFLTDGFDHLKRPSLENSARFNVGTMIGSYVTLFEDLCHGREVTSLIS